MDRTSKVSGNWVAFLSITLALLGLVGIHLVKVSRDDQKLKQRATELYVILERTLAIDFEIVHASQNLFYTLPDASRQNFARFTKQTLQRHQEIQALEYMVRVSKKERTSFEAKTRVEGFKEFSLSEVGVDGKLIEAPTREDYHVIHYLEPYAGNEAAHGYNIQSMPSAKDALKHAQESGVGISQWLALAQGEIGFVTYMAIQGDRFAVGVFRLSKFIENAMFRSPDPEVSFILSEESAQNNAEAQTFYFDASRSKVHVQSAAKSLELLNSKPSWQHKLKVGNQVWDLQFFPSDRFVSTIPSSFIFLVPLLIAAMGGAIILLLQSRRKGKLHEDFLNVASHELRFPILPLKRELIAFRRLLLSGDQGQLQKSIEAAEMHLVRFDRLMSQLLDISKMTEGKLTLTLEKFDFVALVKSSLAQFSFDLEAANCSIELDAPKELLVHWDSIRIEQVLTNLLSSVIHSWSGSKILLKIESPKIDSKDQKVIITLKESGAGIAAFDQSELALQIIEQIIHSHQGTFKILSGASGGVELHIEIPKSF